LIFSNLCLLTFTAAVAAEGDCYKNKPGPAPNYVGSSSEMMPSKCNKMCADKKYSYFGVRWSKECWCGNDAPDPSLKLDMSKCYKMCSGIPTLPCGGAHEANVYKVCKEANCKFSGEEEYLNMMKERYISLDHNDKEKYLKEVRKMLPTLLAANALSSLEEVGIARVVTDQTKYPLAPLTGDDVELVKSKSKVESINGTVTSFIGKKEFTWATTRATGFYAAPGEFVTVTIPEDLVDKISVEIGQDHWRINYKKFVNTTQKFASPFGGLIRVKLDDRGATSKKGMFEITVDNAIEAPHFVLGQSTNEDWENMKKSASPWSVLRVPGQVHIFIETLKAKKVTDMSSVMSGVKKTMDEYDDMMGIPLGIQPGEERLHYDPNCHYGGYTIDGVGNDGHLCIGGGTSVVHPAFINEMLESFGDGVAGHEIGHRGCYPDLPYMGVQWTAEIVRHYLDVKRGFVNWDRWANPFSVLSKMVGFKTFSKGRPCYEAYESKHFPKGIQYKVGSYENCWTVLYRLPLLEFGVDVYRKVMTANNQLPDIKWKKLPEKTERLVDLYCKATKHNMIPFFKFFNIDVDAAVATPCEAQPLPTVLTGFLKVANCIQDENTQDIECSKMPEFPDYKGLCLLSGVCQKDPANDNKTTTFDNKIDIYGGNKTRDNEDDCHDRAIEAFKRCGNDRSNPMTATYRLKDGTSTSTTVPVSAGNCYVNRPGPAPKYVGWDNGMVPAKCNKMCADKKYSYFGVRWSHECWCGNEAPNTLLKLDMKKCFKRCGGDSSLPCGGDHEANVWKVCKETNCEFSYE